MHPYVRSGLMTLAVVSGLALLAGGFIVAEKDDFDLPDVVESIKPSNGEIIGSGDTVGADLDDAYTGVLAIDGAEIPEDQLTRVESLGQVYFRPHEAADVESYEPGVHRVTVTFWPRADSRDSSKTFTWEFRVA